MDTAIIVEPGIEEEVTIESIMQEEPPVPVQEETEVVDTSEEETPSGEEQPVQDVQKAKENTPKWLQARVDKVVSDRKSVEAENKKLQDKITELENDKISASEPIAPDREAFDTVEDWQQAMSVYQKESNAFYNVTAASQKRTQAVEEDLQADIQKFLSGSEKLSQRFEDFDSAIDNAEYLGLNEVFFNTTRAPEISYYLAKNPKEINRIASLGDRGQAIEIGKLEAKFDNFKTTTTNAPAPLNTLKGGSDTVVTSIDDIEDDGEDCSQWYAAYKKGIERKFKKE